MSSFPEYSIHVIVLFWSYIWAALNRNTNNLLFRSLASLISKKSGMFNVIYSGVLNLSCLVNKEWTMYCCEQ